MKIQVKDVVPDNFESYIRICHPGHWIPSLSFESEAQQNVFFLKHDYEEYVDEMVPVTWHDTARRNGKTPYALMRWYDIAKDIYPLAYVPPAEGDWTRDMVEHVCDVLEGDCWVGIWTGYGGHYRSAPKPAPLKDAQIPPEMIAITPLRFSGDEDKIEVGEAIRTVHDMAKVTFMNDEYYVKKAPLEEIRDEWITEIDTEGVGLTPNFVFTEDWYLAIPYNMRSSYFCGASETVGAVVDGLETYAVQIMDDISNSW